MKCVYSKVDMSLNYFLFGIAFQSVQVWEECGSYALNESCLNNFVIVRKRDKMLDHFLTCSYYARVVITSQKLKRGIIQS